MSGIDAKPRSALPVHLDGNLRDEHLRLDLEVLDAVDALHRVPRSPSQPPQLAEIVAEDLDRDLGADAGEQVVEPVRDRLAHVDGDAGDLVELVADLAEDRLSTALGLGQIDVDLRVVDALRVLIELGATGPTAGGDDLGDLAHEALGERAEAVRFLERCTRPGADVDSEGSFVERWEELAAEERHRRCRGDDERQSRGHHRLGVPHREREDAAVRRLDLANEPPVVVIHPLHRRQEVRAQRRGDREGDDERRQDRHDVRDAERREQASFDSAQREEWHEDQDDEHRREHDRVSYFARGITDDVDGWTRALEAAVLAEAPEHVLDVDDRVVDELANGDGEAAEGHGVDGETKGAKDERRDDERQRDGGQRDRRRPEVEEEQEQHDGDENCPVTQALDHIVNGALDEGRLAEETRIDGDAGRHRLLQLGDGDVDPLRQSDGVRAGLLLNRQDRRGLRVNRGVSALDSRSLAHGGDLPERHRGSVAHGEDGARDIGLVARTADGADEELEPAPIDVPSGGVGVRLLDGAGDVVERELHRRELRRINRDVDLAHFAANRNDLRDAGEGEQPWPDDPVGLSAQLHRRHAVPLHTDQHDLAHDGGDGTHPGDDASGELLGEPGEALGDQLPIAIDVS